MRNGSIETARENVGMLRLYAGCHPQDHRLARIVEDLTTDPDFRGLWADQDVCRSTYNAKRYRHPIAGELTPGFETCTPSGAPRQTPGLHPRRTRLALGAALRML
ncbi:hypothetical protein ACZ90_67540 [Streptomyces albus subsp. albus]|nr:hypothetical protein ACZ90_67540 [Streptomyces albus subsp. albus]